MRSLLLAGLLVSPAFANPCGKPQPTKLHTAANWIAVHQRVSESKTPLASDAKATEDMCQFKPCGPNEPISVVSGINTLALAIKNPPGSYSVIELPFMVPPTVFDARLSRLANHLVHVHMEHEDFAREPFCEDEDRDENGECKEWVTATVIDGYTTGDAIVNTISRAVEWKREVSEGDDSGLPGRRSGVVRLPNGLLGHWKAGATSPTEWFQFQKGKCVAAAAPVDMKAKLKAARKAASKGALPDAIGIFGELLTYAPGHAAYLSERGYLRMKAGDSAGAATDFGAALKATPDNKLAGVIFFNRGLLKESKGDTKGALGDFQEANRRRPSKAAKKKIKALGG